MLGIHFYYTRVVVRMLLAVDVFFYLLGEAWRLRQYTVRMLSSPAACPTQQRVGDQLVDGIARTFAGFCSAGYLLAHQHDIRNSLHMPLEHFARNSLPRADPCRQALVVLQERLHRRSLPSFMERFIQAQGWRFCLLVALLDPWLAKEE